MLLKGYIGDYQNVRNDIYIIMCYKVFLIQKLKIDFQLCTIIFPWCDSRFWDNFYVPLFQLNINT